MVKFQVNYKLQVFINFALKCFFAMKKRRVYAMVVGGLKDYQYPYPFLLSLTLAWMELIEMRVALHCVQSVIFRFKSLQFKIVCIWNQLNNMVKLTPNTIKKNSIQNWTKYINKTNCTNKIGVSNYIYTSFCSATLGPN